MRSAKWRVDVLTSANPEDYPVQLEASLFDNPDARASAKIEIAKISPERDCIDAGEAITFMLVDEKGRALSWADWGVEGPGRISKEGIYTSPVDAKGSVTVYAAHKETGTRLDTMSFRLGCECSWSVQFNDRTSEGRYIGYSEIGMMGMKQFTVLFPDADEAPVPSITGQGSILIPSNISVAVQDGEKSYISGLPISLNIGRALGTNTCIEPEIEGKGWSFEDGRWLIVDLTGRLAVDSEFTSGCIKETEPFRLRMRLDLSEHESLKPLLQDLTSQSSDLSDLGELYQTILSDQSLVGQCVPKTPLRE